MTKKWVRVPKDMRPMVHEAGWLVSNCWLDVVE